MAEKPELYERLRNEIIGMLHIGRLRQGDRLRSIRQVAQDFDVDHRMVARVYSMLADEGLVEVRGRSGVYMAQQETNEPLRETTSWMARVMADAWIRRIKTKDVPSLFQRAFGKQLRCVFAESTEDHEVAACAELSADFGLAVSPVRISKRFSRPDGRAVEESLRNADFLVTTAFHASYLAPVAAAVGKPMVTIEVNRLLRDSVMSLLRSGSVTVVMADQDFLERARAYLAPEISARIRLLLVADPRARDGIADRQTLYTRAARRRLGLDEYHLIPWPASFISASVAQKLAETMVTLNLRDERA